MKVKKLKKELRSIAELKEFLKNPSPKVKVPLYTEIEVDQSPTNSGDHTVKTSRLDRIEGSIANLAKEMKDGFKRIDNRIDNLEKDINSRLDNVEKRLDNVDTRLDYIVKANSLKDSK